MATLATLFALLVSVTAPPLVVTLRAPATIPGPDWATASPKELNAKAFAPVLMVPSVTTGLPSRPRAVTELLPAPVIDRVPNRLVRMSPRSSKL